MTRIYVPRDSSALALGADALAEAISSEAARRGMAIELIRNGSRGLLWLEPLVEVATPKAASAMRMSTSKTSPRCSTRASSTAASMRDASAWSTKFRI